MDENGTDNSPCAGYIDVTSPASMQYWAKELGISESVLRIAEKAIGPKASDVRKYLEYLENR